MPLDEKTRLKLDKVFMAFGSQMHALERNTGDQAWREYREEAWAWSITKVSALVDMLYKGEEGKAVTPPPPPEKIGETDTMTVKGVTLQSSGTTKQGRAWKLYKITDTHDTNYFTFHTSFQIGEVYEVDWQWKIDGEKKWRTIPHTPRPVGERADYDDDVPF